MKLPRRQFLHLAMGAPAVLVGSRVAWAQSYPTRPITIIVPIGMGRVARTTPDGYTIGIGTMGTNVLNGAFYSLSYDLLRDLTPIAAIYTTPFVLYGNASLPIVPMPSPPARRMVPEPPRRSSTLSL
jgi:tripartite-type tricarboxylate transporter receptor subunit TctC